MGEWRDHAKTKIMYCMNGMFNVYEQGLIFSSFPVVGQLSISDDERFRDGSQATVWLQYEFSDTGFRTTPRDRLDKGNKKIIENHLNSQSLFDQVWSQKRKQVRIDCLSNSICRAENPRPRGKT